VASLLEKEKGERKLNNYIVEAAGKVTFPLFPLVSFLSGETGVALFFADM